MLLPSSSHHQGAVKNTAERGLSLPEHKGSVIGSFRSLWPGLVVKVLLHTFLPCSLAEEPTQDLSIYLTVNGKRMVSLPALLRELLLLLVVAATFVIVVVVIAQPRTSPFGNA